MPSSTASCTPRTASRSTARRCANQRKNPATGPSLTRTTPSDPLKPSTGELSAIIGMLSAIDRNQCPQSIGTPVRNPRNPHSDTSMLVSLRRGLADVGYTEGRNVAIEYRFTDGRYDRQSAEFSDLTQRKVGVIVFARFVPTDELVQRVRASPIPIVIAAGGDPVRDGLVASLNRPRGNVTGVNNELGELSGKYLGLLRDLVPKAATIAALVDAIGPIRENII